MINLIKNVTKISKIHWCGIVFRVAGHSVIYSTHSPSLERSNRLITTEWGAVVNFEILNFTQIEFF